MNLKVTLYAWVAFWFRILLENYQIKAAGKVKPLWVRAKSAKQTTSKALYISHLVIISPWSWQNYKFDTTKVLQTQYWRIMTPVTSNYDNLILPLVRALAGNSRRVLTIFLTGKTILFDSKNSTVYECYKHIQHIPTEKLWPTREA